MGNYLGILNFEVLKSYFRIPDQIDDEEKTLLDAYLERSATPEPELILCDRYLENMGLWSYTRSLKLVDLYNTVEPFRAIIDASTTSSRSTSPERTPISSRSTSPVSSV